MSTPIHAELTGSFTTNATPSPVTLNLPSSATEIEIINVTDYNAHAAAITKAKGYSSLASGAADVWTGSGANPNVMTLTQVLTGGFTFFSDSAGQSPEAAVAVTGINQANHPLALSATTGSVGDVIRVYGTTNMLQVASMDFSVTAVNAGVSQTLGYIDSSAFAAAATAGFYRRLPFQASPVDGSVIAPSPRFYPRRRYITAITQAAQAVITMSVTHNFQVGEKVRILVPPEFGMTQINGYLATVLAVSHSATVNTITVDFDSSAATAFAFPTSARAATGITFAQVVPVGEAAINSIALPVGNSLDDRTRNTSMNGVIIGSSILVASKQYQWIAKKALVV